MATESLIPDQTLINPNFEGYKLPPDQLTVHTASLVSNVKVCNPRDDLFSLQYIRAIGSVNHLMLDRWQTTCERVYFVDENNEVQQVTVKDASVDTIESVFKIPLSEGLKEELTASIFFPSKDFVCIGDGLGKLYIVHARGRATGSCSEWKVSFLYEFDIPFIITHATHDEKSGSINCLLLSIVEKDNEASAKKAHIVTLTLGAFSEVTTSGSSSFSCEAIKYAQGHSVPLYAALEQGSNAIVVASEKSFYIIRDENRLEPKPFDSQNNVDAKEVEDEDYEKPLEYTYSWFQEGDDVTIRFDLTEGTTKDDIVCVIKPNEIEVGLFNGENLLKGPLFAKVKARESAWTLENNCLEITLEKELSEHHWSSVVIGNTNGKYVLQGEEAQRVQEIHERLEHLTSDKPPIISEDGRMLFNPQQLEQCDDFPEDVEYIMRLDTNTGAITHKVCLASHQWVFNTVLAGGSLPVFCLRHDVDALVWQPASNPEVADKYWSHIATFDALGYVQASKEDRKFSTCAPDMSYAVISDSTKHVYIYHKPKEGAKTAFQRVITLGPPSNSILGLAASNKNAIVLTPKSIHIIKVL